MRAVEPTLFFIVFAFSISLPTIKQLIFNSLCEREFNTNQKNCLQNVTLNNKIQSLASQWAYTKSMFTIIPSVVTPFIFAYFLSYKNPTMFFLIPLTGAILDIFFYVIFTKVTSIKPFYMIILSATFEWFGGLSSFNVILQYYMLLVNDSSKLVFRFVLLGVCNNLGSFLAGLILTFVIAYIDYTSALLCSFLLLSTALLYTAFLQPVKMKPRPMIPRLTHIKQIASSLKTQFLQRKVDVLLTLASQFLLNMSHYGTADLKINYYLRTEFQVTPAEIGILLSASSVVEILGPFICIPLMNRYAKKRMWIFAAAVSIIMPIHFLLLAFAKSRNMIYLATLFVAFSSIYGSFLSSVIKKLFTADNMIFFLGISSSFMLFSILIGTTAMNTVYQNSLRVFPGTPFVLSSVLNFFGGVLATIIVYRNFRIYDEIETIDDIQFLEDGRTNE